MNRQQRRAAAKQAGLSKQPLVASFEVGLQHFQSGRLIEAEACCRQVLAADPGHADALHLLGLICAQTGKLDLAVDFLAQAIRLNSGNPEYFRNLGTILGRQGRRDESLRSYDLALSLDPDSVPGWVEFGQLLQQMGRTDQALLAYDRALSIDPRHIEALHKSGMVLSDRGEFDRAVAQFEKVIEIEPGHVAALNNLAVTLIDLKRYREALSTIDRALSISPDMAELHSNRSNVLKGLGRYEDALASSDRAVALKPDYVQAHCNRGCLLDEMARPAEALASYRRALKTAPDHADAHWNLAINRLRCGDLRTGWIESEWRWKCTSLGLLPRNFPQPAWRGSEPIEGKTILLYNDQGLGDAIQFLRYVPRLAARGARVVLEIEDSLKELCGGLAGVSQCIAKGDTLPDFDVHCSLGSLPLAFDTTLNTVPAPIPYLASPAKTNRWSALCHSRLPKIGLVWAGYARHVNDHNRSIPLQLLLPLLEVEAQFVSLQKNIRPLDAELLASRPDILDLAPELQTFSDTAAVISNLDLVISVDTSVAHLAGALGLPFWLLLPYVPDWRWLIDRNDSPWYPTAHLFRQTQSREWPSVIQRVKTDLQEIIRNKA